MPIVKSVFISFGLFYFSLLKDVYFFLFVIIITALGSVSIKLITFLAGNAIKNGYFLALFVSMRL